MLDNLPTFRAKTNFGIKGEKRLKKLILKGKGKFSLLVQTGGGRIVQDVDLDGETEFPVDVKIGIFHPPF